MPDAVDPFCLWLWLLLLLCWLSLCYSLLLGWHQEGKGPSFGWAQTKKRHAVHLICQCQCWALKLLQMMVYLEGQLCWTAAIFLFTPFWMNKWLNVGEMTTCAHIILQSGSEWEHRSLHTSFPAAQLDITCLGFFSLFLYLAKKVYIAVKMLNSCDVKKLDPEKWYRSIVLLMWPMNCIVTAELNVA